MNKEKVIALHSSLSFREFTKRMENMDLQLLSIMVDEAWLGNRIDVSWIS